jgi:hypothetical protein
VFGCPCGLLFAVQLMHAVLLICASTAKVPTLPPTSLLITVTTATHNFMFSCVAWWFEVGTVVVSRVGRRPHCRRADVCPERDRRRVSKA